MELGLSNTVLAGDPRLIDHIVGEVKSQGIFDQFRKECIADVDTKPAYQNLRTRVEGSVNSFLSKQTWKPDLNKNQLRETLRKQIHDAPYLDAGVERIVDQVVNPKVYSVFMPQIEDVVYKFLGIERPKAKEKNGCGLKDLLPKDLDPVSPESDKNSLKDESLESLDINDTSDLNGKQDDKADEQKQDEESCRDKNKVDSENGHIEEKTSDEVYKMNKTGSNSNLNTSSKSDDKVDEEEEEVSPTFEPIDIMNLNESNISNDSHLSGISELTSHRSRSPDFSNELSRDNFEYSNQDSQLSKVSSDSRLSIVTDFGSSNHDLTPVHDSSRDETTKDKYETKSNKDNFKAIRELDSSKNKTIKNSFDFAKSKDDCKDTKDFKSTKSVSSKENSRDATDSSIKDKYEHRNKEKSRDSESIKSSKSTKEKSVKDAKYYKEKSNEKKKSSSEKCDKHSSEKYDKHSKSKPKVEQTKESFDKTKDISENIKDNANKLKDEKLKEPDKKDNVNKEVKDLKDIYKEKIRELREKKELTEKEKLNKDKDIKLMKEVKDKKDPLKDKKSNKKEHKSSSSSSSKNPSTGYHESKSNKTSEKIVDGKDKRSESKDKAKRDEKRLSKENKSYYSSKSDLSDKSDKSDSKKISRSEKEDKSGKADVKKDVKTSGEKTTNGKKDVKSHLQQSKSSDRAEKSDGRKESKTDSPSKDKKRREDKKSKTKDDHSSLRKNSNDRRSTDRDGSNGSNNKTSPSNSSNSNVTSNKSSTSNLTKENHVSNSGSETSDSIEETQVSDSKLSHQSNCKLSHKVEPRLPTNDKNQKMEIDNSNEAYDKQEGKEEEENTDSHTNLPLKKRLLSNKDDESISGDVKLKKPKFAKNIHEAKKLMKIRKQMEKQKLKEDKKVEKKVAQEDQMSQSNTKSIDNLESMPDHERVQIIEIPDEEYEEPYPEKHESRLMLDERSIIMPGTESCSNEFLKELNVTQSSSEAVSSVLLRGVQVTEDSKTDKKHDVPSNISSTEDTEDLQAANKKHKDNSEEGSKNEIFKHLTDTERYYLQAKESILPKLNEIASEKSESLNHNENKIVEQSIEGNMKLRDNQTETQDDNEETKNDRSKIRNDDKESSDEKQIKIHVSYKTDIIDSNSEYTGTKSSSSVISEDNEDCRYFKTDNEKSERFSNFLESLELVENSSLEDIIESLGGKVVSSMPKSMAAPPLPKLPKRSSSPLSDILVNNSDNNNDGHKRKLSSSPNEDAVHNVKKRKFTKKSRFSNLCNPQGISNGENFVMPLSPDSDVSATSDKTASSTVIKEEKSRNRTSHQRYSSDDLYKPRPLFSSSSRRSRRSNQA
ncbi:LOW QUALITY PROTEIN: biorientation of chromosomes in cell division protein 1-like 1 [Pogonomyrmex barbatus]|uniref:LOW QUALITY PROTEIN: biorientation of chromosomes in cell division protein 1-like 1 n=1 Tax=Pogonomyrmex barbatus TaxID=144034 RepID=A0A6I9WJM2_9HYME|nr:LOW QUALITY PROTEIN: biorientation of chromosomes in cell division protein 1-like 1 [Pogonomyrmex barbatus]